MASITSDLANLKQIASQCKAHLETIAESLDQLEKQVDVQEHQRNLLFKTTMDKLNETTKMIDTKANQIRADHRVLRQQIDRKSQAITNLQVKQEQNEKDVQCAKDLYDSLFVKFKSILNLNDKNDNNNKNSNNVNDVNDTDEKNEDLIDKLENEIITEKMIPNVLRSIKLGKKPIDYSLNNYNNDTTFSFEENAKDKSIIGRINEVKCYMKKLGKRVQGIEAYLS